VTSNCFLPHRGAAIGHTELPVVPLTCDEFALEIAGDQSVALMRAGVVEGMHSSLGSGQHHAMAIDFDHFHLADGHLGYHTDLGLRGVIVGAGHGVRYCTTEAI